MPQIGPVLIHPASTAPNTHVTSYMKHISADILFCAESPKLLMFRFSTLWVTDGLENLQSLEGQQKKEHFEQIQNCEGAVKNSAAFSASL
jgi:hypothetical protein